MATGQKVASLPAAALVDFLGESVEVRKSQVEGKRYPLYLVTPWGPWPINTPAGQDFILEHAIFNGAPVIAANDPIIEAANDPEPEQEPEYPEPEPEIEPEQSGAFAAWVKDLGDFG